MRDFRYAGTYIWYVRVLGSPKAIMRGEREERTDSTSGKSRCQVLVVS